jgi:hypothetical protein
MLMGLGALATVAVKRPENLAILVIDTKGPILVVLKVSATRDPLVLPPWDGAFLRACSARLESGGFPKRFA